MSVSMRTPSRAFEFVVGNHGCELISHRDGRRVGWFEPGTNSRFPDTPEYPAELRKLRLKTTRGTRAGLASFASALLSHRETPQNVLSAVSVWYSEHKAYGGRSPKTELSVYDTTTQGKMPGLAFQMTVRPTALAVQVTDFSNDADRNWYFTFIWAHAAVADAVSFGNRITSAFPDDLQSLCRNFAAGDTTAPLIDWLMENEGVPPIVKSGVDSLQRLRLSGDAEETHHTNRRAVTAA